MIILLIGMWRTLSSILGLSKESNNDTDEEDEVEELPLEGFMVFSHSSQPASDEEREFIGIVTSLYSAYGLINHEICFTADAVGGSMPNVGDKVHVVACRKNAVGGWRAKRVWIASDDEFLTEPQSATSSHSPSIPLSFASDVKAASFTPEQHSHEQLLEDKDGISITGCMDFGNMQLGDSASLSVLIRYELQALTTFLLQ